MCFRTQRRRIRKPVPAAILFLRDPESPTPAILALQELFGLTGTQTSVASALAEGKLIEDTAANNGVSIHTTRTHRKNILAKTGTSRQAQLVAVILCSVAVTG